MADRPDYLESLDQDSARFVTVLRAADPALRVPTCPDWSASDLLWHLTEVQWFWGTIVERRLQDNETAEDGKPDRPTDHEALADLFVVAWHRLRDALASADDATPVWTWTDDETVGFVRRRQAHEALIHRVDAELTVGDPTPLDPALSADGVDELLRVMWGAPRGWGEVRLSGTNVLVEATDTGTSWRVDPAARFAGTSPNTGNSYDMTIGQVLDTGLAAPPFDSGSNPGEPAAAIRGDASSLDRWLWGRAETAAVALDRTGDAGALAAFDALVADGIE